MVPLRVAIRGLRRRIGPNRAIPVFHIDQPSNDFTTLFAVLDADPDGYVAGEPNVFPRCHREIVLSERTSARVRPCRMVVVCGDMRSQIPLIPGHFFPARSTGMVRTEFERQSAKDWEAFLLLRAKELRPSGRLVGRLTIRTLEIIK